MQTLRWPVMNSRTIRTGAQFEAVGRLLAGLKKPFTLTWKAGEDRSHSQNALMWKWAGEAASQLGDRMADDLQREWKLTIGVPILRSEDADFCAFYDKALRPRSYQEKLEAMRYIPVTSIMTVPQMGKFMDAVQRQCLDDGLVITIPEDR